MIIKVEKPTLRRKDMDAVLQTMADEQIGPGEQTKTFIALLQETLGTSVYAVALRGIIDALTYALKGLALPANSVVGISALSPSIYETVVTSVGCRIHIFDIDSETGTISFDALKEYGAENISALILYEPYGNIPSNNDWKSLGIPIIEDITESFGSVYGERTAGDIGDIVVCAFEEYCTVSTAGGAAISTSDRQLVTRIETALQPVFQYIELPGMNAALGVVQLAQMQKNLARRKVVYEKYRQSLMKTRHQLFGVKDIDFSNNGHGFVVVLDSKPSDVQQFALRYEVATSMAFVHTVISDQLDRFDLFPQAIPCVTRAIRFPLYPFLSNQQILQIEKVISHLP
jgi:dTDP-4-amino-4,6-dideoxygalactose transaminase